MTDPAVRDTVDRALSAWAHAHAGIARALDRLDPTLGAEVTELADGLLVLCGPGMYVNAAVACGRAAPLTDDDWATIAERSHGVGVSPSIEMSVTTHAGTRSGAVAQGYRLDDARDAFVLRLHPDHRVSEGAGVAGVEIVEIDEDDLGLWQDAAAAGFGHATPDRRSVSDRWAHAALLAGDRMFVASSDGRPVASAILHVTDGVATVGGMSTVPAARGRGIQAAMLRQRIALAAEAGADLVVSTAASPGSARNLERAGFEHAFSVETWTR